uniref:Uncharacterized protein n=1 Tax=Arundo donax TaxID=35708 RepID=A0A0A9EMQ7_ARUDO
MQHGKKVEETGAEEIAGIAGRDLRRNGDAAGVRRRTAAGAVRAVPLRHQRRRCRRRHRRHPPARCYQS